MWGVLISVISAIATSVRTEVLPSFAEPISNVSVPVGSEAILSCTINNFRYHQVAWIRRNRYQILLSTYHFILIRDARYSISHNDSGTWWLRIEDVKDADEGEYICQIKISNYYISQSGYLEVLDMSRYPINSWSDPVTSKIETTSETADIGPSFAEPIPNRTVAVGGNFSLPCTINNLGDSEVAWYHGSTNKLLSMNHVIVSDGRYPRHRVKYDGSQTWWLSFLRVQESDKGQYTCEAMTTPKISQSGYIDVLVPPRFTNSSPQRQAVDEGSDVSLSCKASGNPLPKIKWGRGIELVPGMEGEFLNISKASRLDMGLYFCIASNGVSYPEQLEFWIDVKFAPTLSITTKIVDTPLGTDVILECGVESYPSSKVYWIKDFGDIIRCSSKYDSILLHENRMRLGIRDFNPDDYGTYKCIAKNDLGETEDTIQLNETSVPTITLPNPFSNERRTNKKILTAADDGPSFVNPIPNITISVGSDVTLPCVTNNVGDHNVQWIHSYRLLTLNNRVIASKARFGINHSDCQTWSLIIKDVKETDGGEYTCSINTSPYITRSGFLKVIELGEEEGTGKLNDTVQSSACPYFHFEVFFISQTLFIFIFICYESSMSKF